MNENQSNDLMSPEQIRSYTYMINTLQQITSQRTLYNTNARVELVHCFKIANGLLIACLMNEHQCALFDRYITSLFMTLQRPHFAKYHPQLMGALHSMEDRARMNLYKILYKLSFTEISLWSLNQSYFLESFIARYGGKANLERFLAFV